jgi:uncharacterized protein
MEDFRECITDLLDSEQVQRLDSFKQHFNTSRFHHSINVAYYSYRICKALRFLGFDYVSAARAGVLHDLFLYDWRERHTKLKHTMYHPKNALENARGITEVNNIEADAILKHMFPLCTFPKFKESYIVSLADKYCTVGEIMAAGKAYVKRGFK